MDQGCGIALGPSGTAATKAFVVWIPLTPTLGEIPGHERLARWTSHLSSKRKDVGEPMMRLGVAATGDNFTDTSKLSGADHWHMPATILIAAPGIANDTGIVRISKHMVEELRRDQTA